MKIHKDIGSKGRLFEIFENVNKIKINESNNKLAQPIIPNAINIISLNPNVQQFDTKEEYLNFINNENYFSASHSHAFYSGDEYNEWHSNGNKYNNNDSKESDILFNTGDLVGVWDNKNSIGFALPNNIMGEDIQIKESNSIEIGTDSGIFHMLYSYFSRNLISNEEFPVGELNVHLQAEPTTWEDVPYRAATHMQPEEGGSPEDVKGQITDIVIWDAQDNEYRLSQDAFVKLNSTLRGFDGNLYDELVEKAINNNSSNESLVKEDENINEMIPSSKNDTSGDSLKSYLEKNYDQGKKTIEIQNVVAAAQKFNVDQKVAERLATNIIKDYNTPNRTITYGYDEKGNWIPKGHEDKMLALRPVELPIGSNNDWIYVASIDNEGGLGKIHHKVKTWKEAKEAMASML